MREGCIKENVHKYKKGLRKGKNMLNMIKGASVPQAESLEEAYEIRNNVICANVNAEKIEELLKDFIAMHKNEPLFFILEIPCNANEEEADENGVINEYHKNVYYIDGLSAEQSLAILDIKGELLINDGLSCFGFGGHESQDELMKGNYNVCTMFSKNEQEVRAFFGKHNIPATDKLITAWDTFDKEHPGMSSSYSVNGERIEDLVTYFKEWGIYLAERRPE